MLCNYLTPSYCSASPLSPQEPQKEEVWKLPSLACLLLPLWAPYLNIKKVYWTASGAPALVMSMWQPLCPKRWVLLCPFYWKEKGDLSSLPKVTQKDLLFPRPAALTIRLDYSLPVGCVCVCACMGVGGCLIWPLTSFPIWGTKCIVKSRSPKGMTVPHNKMSDERV